MPIYAHTQCQQRRNCNYYWQIFRMPTVKLKALAKFNGVKRRFTKVGEFEGVAIIDDYGHHPTEIATTLQAA